MRRLSGHQVRSRVPTPAHIECLSLFFQRIIFPGSSSESGNADLLNAPPPLCKRRATPPPPTNTMSFSGDDDEGGLGAAKDAALDKVQDLFAAGKEKMDKVGWQNSYAFEASNAKPPLNY